MSGVPKKAYLAIIALLLFPFAKTWYSSSAYMNRPPRVDAAEFLPGGLRINGQYGSVDIKIPAYRAAGVRTFHFAKNLHLIIERLGQDYLDELKRVRGKDDGYSEWAESPIDMEAIKRRSPEDAVVLASFQKACAEAKRKDQSACSSLSNSRRRQGIFFTFGEGRIVILDPKQREIHIAYSGPHTGERR